MLREKKMRESDEWGERIKYVFKLFLSNDRREEIEGRGKMN